MQFVSEQEICHGAECLFRVAVRVRVPELLRVLVSGSESCKKHDKQLTFIVRVMFRPVYCLVVTNCQPDAPIFIQQVCSPELRVQVKDLIFL